MGCRVTKFENKQFAPEEYTLITKANVDYFLVLAHLCNAVYESSYEKIVEYLQRENIFIDKLKFYDSGTSTALSGYLNISNQNVYLVCFRGTYCIEDMLNNMECFVTSRTHFGEVSNGFHDSYNNMKIKTEFFKDILQILYTEPSTKIVITGHSLGGTSANLLAGELYNLFGHTNNLDMRVCTFASPRVWTEKSAPQYENKFENFRVISIRDPIVNFPLKSLDFVHIGKLFLISDDMNNRTYDMTHHQLINKNLSGYIDILRQKK
jgi:hypothetical protein